MTDTDAATENRFRRMLLSKSGAERLRVGLSMFDSAKTMALAGLRAETPDLDEDETKRRLFKRLYGDLFSGPSLARVLKGLGL